MTIKLTNRGKFVLGACVAILALISSDDYRDLANLRIISQAEARVGRPLTPLSYAGVARRTTRRRWTTEAALGVVANSTPPGHRARYACASTSRRPAMVNSAW